MATRLPTWRRWALMALCVYVLIVVSNRQLPVDAQTIWLRAAEYALWAALALGAIARFAPALSPYGWRPVTIFLGAALSGLDVFVGTGPVGNVRIDAWMTALMGIAVVTILARVLPSTMTRFWFGQEVVRRGSIARPPR